MENEEIDLIEVIAKLWRRRKVIGGIVLIFLLTGTATAFLLPRKYTARCTLGLEVEDKTTRISVEGMSAFQSTNIADMRNTRIVTPSMYPDILFSVPFQKELIYAPLFSDRGKDSLSFYDYLIFQNKQKMTDDHGTTVGVQQLSKEEEKCLGYLKKALNIELNNKDGYLKLSVDMDDPQMAARMAYQMQQMLQNYIAKFRIAKAQAGLDFIEGRYVEVKHDLEQKQQALIDFREQNKNQSSIQLETEEKILTNDYELFFGLYSDIVQQREKAKMQVKEDMPILTVIEPVVVPTDPSKPKRGLVILASLFLGLFVGCGYVLVKPVLSEIRHKK
ncbi:MAG: Wzz/FepE/Etk N-terminal domain-containing protein [Odoribacter sp.]